MSVELIQNLVLITFLGVLLAFNPMLIVVDVFLVLRTKRPVLNTVFLTAGFVSAILLLMVLAGALVDPDSQINLRKIKDNLQLPPIIDIFAGGILLGYAAKRLRAPKSKKTVSKTLTIPEKPFHIFLFGFLKAPLSATNIFAVLILARLAAVNNWNIASVISATLWLLLVGIVPLATIVYYHQFKQQSLVTVDRHINQVLSRDTSMLISYGLAAIGLFFATSGFIELAT